MRNFLYLFIIAYTIGTLLSTYSSYRNLLQEIENIPFTTVLFSKMSYPKTVNGKMIVIGKVSWYDYDLERKDQKCRTNTCYSKSHATCASRDYPKGTVLRVVRLDTNAFTTCVVNDFGPEEFTGRVLDLSSYAFSQLASLKIGVLDEVFMEPIEI